MEFQFKNRSFECGERTLVMAIMNVTPDSFSEHGENFDLDMALVEAQKMIALGVDLIDVGGESTRPGALDISIKDEINRVVPFIKALRALSDIPISIDTWKSEVASAAIEAGADIINDVSGFHRDSNLKFVAAETGVGCIAMHMRGTPKDMQKAENLKYENIISELCCYFKDTVSMLKDAGVSGQKIMLDPGVGFSKSVEQNIELIKELPQFRALGFPILLGTSRKSFIGHVLGEKEPGQRVWGTAATVTAGIMNQADMVRVHDYKEMLQVTKISDLFR